MDEKQGGAWLLLPAALCLMLFVWLLTLHPEASGRIYATYGDLYCNCIDMVAYSRWCIIKHNGLGGAVVVFIGAGIIISGWK